MYHNKAKHYYGFYVPVDQMISKQYWVSVGPGSVRPRKPETEQHCFKKIKLLMSNLGLRPKEDIEAAVPYVCIPTQLYFSICRGGEYSGYRGCCSICPLCPSWQTISPAEPTLQREGRRTQYKADTTFRTLKDTQN